MKNNIVKMLIYIFLILYLIPINANGLELNSIQKKIEDIRKNEVILIDTPEYQMFTVLEYITKNLNNATISKNLIKDTLTVIDSTDFIEEKFPQISKLNFPENFLVGSNLSLADLTNASFFLNSLNKKRLQKLKNLNSLSKKNNIASEINIKIIEDLSLQPSRLIKQLEEMPKLDLVSLSSSINLETSSVLKSADIISNNLNEATSSVNSSIAQTSSQLENATTTLSRAAGAAMAAASYSLDQAATEIANTIAAGVSVDLDAAAQGLGHDDFASAVEAYNEQYGTNYSVESAREALGQ